MVDISLSKRNGGKIAEVISSLEGKKLECTCGKRVVLNDWEGYSHDGGVEDENGEKYWLFHVCPKCKYQWSWWKVVNRVNRDG
jgi:hypothetical protein